MADIEGMNLEEAVFGVGLATLHVVRGANRAGHVTLRGHLHYQHEHVYDNQGQVLTADYVRWLRFMTSWGKNERDNNPEPHLLYSIIYSLEQCGMWSLGGLRSE